MQALGAAQQPLVDGIADAAVALERLVDAHFAALSDLSAGPVAAAVLVAAPPAVPFPSLSPLASRLPALLPAPLPSPSPSALDADSPAAHPAASAPAGHAAVKRDIAVPAVPSCRIVVVDDDQGARTGLGLLLEAWGASVQAFASIAALARWLQEPGVCAPDLLILDYHLPRPGDGLEALRLVRQAWPVRPVPASSCSARKAPTPRCGCPRGRSVASTCAAAPPLARSAMPSSRTSTGARPAACGGRASAPQSVVS